MDETTLLTNLLALGRFALWLCWRGCYYTARFFAQFMAALLPPATSRPQIAARSLAIVAGWVAGLALLFALIGGGTGAALGALTGAVIGLLAASALVLRGRAEMQAAAGAVTIGNQKGALGVRRPHLVPRATRVRHLAVYGATGSGKSTVLKNLVLQDARAPGRPGIAVVDIKDSLVTEIAAILPPERLADVLLFDPTDREFPPAFNPLAGVPEEGRTLAAAEVLSALRRLYADMWGPRLEHVLRMTLLTLLETPEATLLDIARILTNPEYRAWAAGQVTNLSVRAFWEQEFPSITGGRGSLANVESILNKLSVFVYPELRNVLGQTRRGLDLRQAMDNGQIVLIALPQGILGEDAANFLGALLVGKVQLAAQSRVALPHAQRRTFYLIVDEFQNYATSAFDKLITEGRSMGVGVVAACQFREQLEPSLRLALEKNCAFALYCRFVEGKHRVTVLKLQEPEAPDAEVLLRPLPPPHATHRHQLEQVRARARQLLAQPRDQVEAAIAARLAQFPHGGSSEPPRPGGPKKSANRPPAPGQDPEVNHVRFFE